jgi:predicted DNA-binding protein
MSPKRFTAFRLDEELLRGLEELKERDGMPQAEAVRRAIRVFLESKGIQIEKADRKRVATRKRS